MAFEVVRDAAAACRRAALGNLGEVFGSRAAVALRLAVEGPAEPALERRRAHGLRLFGVAGCDGMLRFVLGKAELGGKAYGILEDALDGSMALVADAGGREERTVAVAFLRARLDHVHEIIVEATAGWTALARLFFFMIYVGKRIQASLHRL